MSNQLSSCIICLASAAFTLGDDPEIRSTTHIHVASKPDWYEIIDDDLKKFDGD